MKFLLKNQNGMSLIESLGSLAILSIVIAGTVGAGHYLHDLQYTIDVRIIDDHFNRIHRFLSYGSCDSFAGDDFSTEYINHPDTGLVQKKGSKIPEIKFRRACVGLSAEEEDCGFEVLYAVKDSVVREDGQPIKTYLDEHPHLYIKSMSLKKVKPEGYALLTVVFQNDRVGKSSSKSLRQEESLGQLKEKNRGEIERTMRIYLEMEEDQIKNCSAHPMHCERQDKEVVLSTDDGMDCATGANLSFEMDRPSENVELERTASGKFKKFEYKTDHCICNFQFYCQQGFWQTNKMCLRREK